MTKTILWMIALTFASCAFKVKRPMNRLITSEAQGKLFRVQAALTASTSLNSTITFGDDKTNNPMETEASSSIPIPQGVGEVGVMRNLDAYAFISLNEAPSVIGAKYQIFGPDRPSAKKGDFSLAVAAGLGGASSRSDEESDIFSDNTQVDLSEDLTEVHLILGYRIENEILATLRLTHQSSTVAGKIKASDSAALVGESFEYNSEATAAHINFMNSLGRKAFWLIDLGSTSLKWSHTPEVTYGTFAVGFGLRLK